MSEVISASGVYEHLRGDILSGSFGAGEWLRTNVLCKRYGVSLSVVREALCRLAEQGLVEATRNKGFKVPRLVIEELEDLTSARLSIEPICLRQSILHGDLEWETSCVGAFHAVRRNPPRKGTDQSTTMAAIMPTRHFMLPFAAAVGRPGSSRYGSRSLRRRCRIACGALPQ